MSLRWIVWLLIEVSGLLARIGAIDTVLVACGKRARAAPCFPIDVELATVTLAPKLSRTTAEVRAMDGDPFLDATTPLKLAHAACAIIVLDDGEYLLQHRDNKPEIFYPGHWTFFGGALEAKETALDTIVRELREEIELVRPAEAFSLFSSFRFGMEFAGGSPVDRSYYQVHLSRSELPRLRLHEGQEMRTFSWRAALSEITLAPFDRHVLWLHGSQGRLRLPDLDAARAF